MTRPGTLGAMARPDHIARVYAVPLPEFTATRNRVAGELRKSGRPAEAHAVAQLRKPSTALWAVNRLASTDGTSLAALFEAVARVRRAQLRDPRGTAEALSAQRAALDMLVSRGREIVTGAGLTASTQALRRLSDTLMGAAVDREHAEALRRGELTKELPPPGFEAFSGARIPERPHLRLVRASRPPTPTPDQEAVAARAVDAERRRTLESEELARSARARVADLERRLRTARQVARQAATAAKRARRKSGRT